MKKEIRFLYIVLFCTLTLGISGCGIMPGKLVSPSEAEKEKREEQNGTTAHNPAAVPTFPAVYPKATR
ncbi:MAG TPA: hypothetical protein DCM27_07510 [Rhodospirillaceae bacterium]|nr:hypothetical protein [Rhodospirillaceae bacterium]